MKQTGDQKTPGELVFPAKLPRRLAAIAYDMLLLFAIFFFATLILLPLTGGNAIQSNNPGYTVYLIVVSFLFYGWFWTHGGQTLGMRAWKLSIQTLDGRPIGWRHVLVRFIAAVPSWALLGAGFLWILVDKDRLAWHDRFSGTMIVLKLITKDG